MECLIPFVRGPQKGMPRTGTFSGYAAHRRAGEEPCSHCKKAALEYGRAYVAKQRHLKALKKAQNDRSNAKRRAARIAARQEQQSKTVQ